jgi:hypothetical protein
LTVLDHPPSGDFVCEYGEPASPNRRLLHCPGCRLTFDRLLVIGIRHQLPAEDAVDRRRVEKDEWQHDKA